MSAGADILALAAIARGDRAPLIAAPRPAVRLALVATPATAPAPVRAAVPACGCAGACRCGGLVPWLLHRALERESEFFREEL